MLFELKSLFHFQEKWLYRTGCWKIISLLLKQENTTYCYKKYYMLFSPQYEIWHKSNNNQHFGKWLFLWSPSDIHECRSSGYFWFWIWKKKMRTVFKTQCDFMCYDHRSGLLDSYVYHNNVYNVMIMWWLWVDKRVKWTLFCWAERFLLLLPLIQNT